MRPGFRFQRTKNQQYESVRRCPYCPVFLYRREQGFVDWHIPWSSVGEYNRRRCLGDDVAPECIIEGPNASTRTIAAERRSHVLPNNDEVKSMMICSSKKRLDYCFSFDSFCRLSSALGKFESSMNAPRSVTTRFACLSKRRRS